MADQPSTLIEADIGAYLQAHERKGLLRFITCGSVDDGKSSLIGRLLYESQMVFEDQLAALAADSRRYGTRGSEPDLALLVDGLAAEREQGITIDVAYRFFSTDQRKFIVADTPGHEQYTRNMVTGASTADAAVLLVDARHGITTQTRRHAFLMSLIGIRKVVLAVNKMDLVDYDRGRFEAVVEAFQDFAEALDIDAFTSIPLSALEGDNVTTASTAMPWYHGPTLLGYLETVEVSADRDRQGAFRLPVQWVNRPSPDFRGFSGMIAEGVVKPGDAVRILPSGTSSRVARIHTLDGDLGEAVAGQSVTLLLEDEVDVSRGDVISGAEAPAQTADQFEATLVWMDDEPLLPGRVYWLKLGTQWVSATVTAIKHAINVDTLEHTAVKQLELNAIAVCTLSLDRAVAFDPYRENAHTGGFILVDRMSHHTAGAGMLHFALRRSQNIHMQHLDVDKQARAEAKGQRPVVLWFTGLSGAGKSAIANWVEKTLYAQGHHTYLLDGDNVRHGLNRDLGFTDADRVENIRRVAEVARLMADAGLIVLTAFISPFISERRMARELMAQGEFIEVFVDTPLALAEARDPKGLYRKARRGELKNFTGIDSAYEPPEAPELRLDTSRLSVEEAGERIVEMLKGRGILG